MLIAGKRWCMFGLMSVAACLFGCIEVEQSVRVHDDGSVSLKGTIKIDPQYEALVLPKMREEMTKKVTPGVRVDFSQRIDGKAAVVVEADGAAAADMLKEDGSTTITVTDGGLMKKRYEYRETVKLAPEIPFPHRVLITLPGSIESVTGGKKTASDTVEFDVTHAKRGDVYVATSTAFAFSFGGGGTTAADIANPAKTAWLIPASIGSICAGVALFLTGWLRSRQATRSSGARPIVAASMPVALGSSPVREAVSVFCSECGAPNAAGRKFCGKCGHTLG